MKKVLKICFEILFCFAISLMILNSNNKVNAASVSVSGGSLDVGETKTISISIPSGYCGYSDGSVTSSDPSKVSIVSWSAGGVTFSTGGVNNMSAVNYDGSGEVKQVPSITVTVKGVSEGSASINVNMNLCNFDGQSVGAAGSSSITVNGSAPSNPEPSTPLPEEDNSNNEPASTPAPVQTPDPEPEQEPEFRNVNETVYATKKINVRSSWSTGSSRIGGLEKNQAVTRTGIGDNGWSRISYNGKTAYVSSSLITTTEPTDSEEPENPEELSEEPEEVVEEIVENGAVEKTDEEIYQEIVSNIGTIPEVGKNYNIFAFLGICIMAVFSIVWLFKKI